MERGSRRKMLFGGELGIIFFCFVISLVIGVREVTGMVWGNLFLF